MTDEAIHVLFCTSDFNFAQIIGDAVGDEFDLRASGKFHLASLREQAGGCHVVLLDLRKGSPDYLILMDQIRQLDSPPPIIVMLDNDDVAGTRTVFERGAYDTVDCPPNIAELRMVLRRAYKFRQAETELRRLKTGDRARRASDNFVVYTEPMQKLLAFTHKIAPCDVSVLITGETGTGKELLAREIHRLSSRQGGPFVAFSCANLPETLIDDELFGHEKGAFTGATGVRRGRLESADKGTLFLDEIGDLALGLQAKLLRVLQQRTFERLGSNAMVSVDFRLLCATHRDLKAMVVEGKFREDLYYRLNVVQLQVPPLRDRRDGIATLGCHFLRRFARQFNKSADRISPAAVRALEEYQWPGNVRELENVIQRAVALAEAETIELWHLPPGLSPSCEPQPEAPEIHFYEDEVREFKRRLIMRTLQGYGGNKVESAKALGIARGYLHRLINQLQIEGDEIDSAAQLIADHATAQQVN
jgi:DNA-binding NtrC family response regulator